MKGAGRVPYMQTYTGNVLHLRNPEAHEIQLADIAMGLARAPRFAGQTRIPYSVAAHSINVARLLAHRGEILEVRLAGLLHDAAEAFFCDMPTPVKWAMGEHAASEYAMLCDNVTELVFEKAGIPPALARDKRVRDADDFMLRLEAHELLNNATLTRQWAGAPVTVPDALILYRGAGNPDQDALEFRKMMASLAIKIHGQKWHSDGGWGCDVNGAWLLPGRGGR